MLYLLVIFHLQRKQIRANYGIRQKTGEKLWEYAMNAPIAPVGPSMGGEMLFVPTGKVWGLPEKENAKGSIIVFGLP
jgi:hypothetical protein